MTNDQINTEYRKLHTAYFMFLPYGYYGALLRQITGLTKGLSQKQIFYIINYLTNKVNSYSSILIEI